MSADVERVSRALFASENCGKSDDVDDRWETCLSPEDRDEYRDLARAAIAAMQGAHVVTTVEEANALPVGAVVRSSSGTIACRASESQGVVFGDDRTFLWHALSLPLEVLYPHPAPDAEVVVTAEQVLAIANGMRSRFGMSNGTQVWVEFQGSAEQLADEIAAILAGFKVLP